jgi:dipeptidyl aminopeptidase/acylaminoacyl peptidase
MKKRAIVPLLLLLLAASFAVADDAYRMPPKAIVDLADAPPAPNMLTGPGDWTVLAQTPALLSIADLAQPELKLAGQRFNPQTHDQTRAPYFVGLRLLNVATGEQKELRGLPSPLRARNVSWAPDGAHVAFTLVSENGVELWIGDVANGSASRLGNVLLNNTSPRRPFDWTSDNRTLIARVMPANMQPPPEASRVPSGPVVQESLGRKAPTRTYQDMLKTPYDEALFEYHSQAQLAAIALDGTVKTIGAPAMYIRAEPSPDGMYLLVESLHRPFSFVVPDNRFPRRIEVWDREGRVVKQLADLPLATSVPTDFNAVPEGPRSVVWRADAPATLAWAEAQDKGNPRVEAAVRDKLFMLAAPFDGAPRELASLATRYNDIYWGSDDVALVREDWWKTRRVKTWRVRPGDPSKAPELLFDLSSEDRYADPGEPELKRNARGGWVLRTAKDGRSIYLNGDGASSEGDRPFLDRFDVAAKKATRLWRSEAPNYEFVVDVLDDDAARVVTRRESPSTPPNFVLRDLTKDLRKKSMKALTDFPHPSPQLANAKTELIQYQRADGVKLNATLYTPPGYDPARDGRLPVLVWAYPQEFKSADAAGQVNDSPYKFIRVSPMGALPWLVRGYAVLDNPSLPIIGEGSKEPNDTYIEQLVAGAKAAIDEVVRRGVGDRDRFAIGGHSYGAFMTANLLAHSDLFRAGIARSGAYNRTLTPFSFQAEERTFWEAPETYIQMSPFTHAQKINEPLLMIHGIDDNNPGTFPIQSERLYQAMSGLGGTVRLVMLPYEAHGYRARESVMHMLWEMDSWLEKYVKVAKK